VSAYIVDNSVWWKASRFPGIADRLRSIATQDLIVTCPPQVLEYCWSARTPAEHDAYRQDLAAFMAADQHPDDAEVLRIQAALWSAGFVRGAGVVDVLIAAYALANDAVVLCADRDYDDVAAVVPGFRHEYLPER
jgi:predicted nucleic acid-binding protein